MKGDSDVSVNKIIQSLEELVQIHERFIQTSKKKTDIIKVGSSEKLQQVLTVEMKLINKLEQAENNRQILVNDWFTQSKHSDNDQSITQMLELLEDEQEVLNLEKITTSLTKAITELKQQEQLNGNLIQQSMQFVQLSLDMLSPSIKNLNYGNDKEITTIDRSVFDSKA